MVRKGISGRVGLALLMSGIIPKSLELCIESQSCILIRGAWIPDDGWRLSYPGVCVEGLKKFPILKTYP